MHMSDSNIFKSDRGQTIIVFALLFSTLVLFTGLALDAGLLYATKAKLSSSVDGACLAGMKNLTLGQPTAATLATNIFNANYGPNPPVPSVTFPIDASNNQQVRVSATANVRTYFIRIISAFATVPVSDTAVATRGKLIMSLVLDRSGSMTSNGGQSALQAAVPLFVRHFSDSLDNVGMISFADNGEIDFSIAGNFTTPISNAVGSMPFGGGTFGSGAGSGALLSNTQGPPLSLAKLQEDSVPILPGQNVSRVVVYFTDGLMNTVQDNFNCPAKVLINYGGFDQQGSQYGDTFDPSSKTTIYGTADSTGFLYNTAGNYCKNAAGAKVASFTSQIDGTQKSFLQSNITPEAIYRAQQTAITMRTEATNPITIYTMGLGTVGATATTLLQQLANDPLYPQYVKSQTIGQYFAIPSCPSNQCTAQLQQAFNVIAARILLRLTA
jgi:Flp pilus assembly protein TadG